MESESEGLTVTEVPTFRSLVRNLEEALGACEGLREERDELVAKRARLEASTSELRRERDAAIQQATQERERLEKLRLDLEAEKRAMAKFGAGPNDLVGLNFGGEKVVTVKRSLLLQFEGSLLANMFSGRHEDQLDRDKDGNVFFDYSPQVMVPLIEYLRLYRDTPPEERAALTPPQLEPKLSKAWASLLQFMGLGEICAAPASTEQVTKFSGIRTDLHVKDLVGWTQFFCRPYSHRTEMADFEPPPELRGGALLVAARHAGSNSFLVAAMGNAEVVTREHIDSSTVSHNGVHWYCRRNFSVGFAPNSRVRLDTADASAQDDGRRLSWHLTQHGGWRAGTLTGLNHSLDVEKVIFASLTRL